MTNLVERVRGVLATKNTPEQKLRLVELEIYSEIVVKGEVSVLPYIRSIYNLAEDIVIRDTQTTDNRQSIQKMCEAILYGECAGEYCSYSLKHNKEGVHVSRSTR